MAFICPIWFFVGCLFSSGIVNSSYHGFALDDNGLLYVGKHGKIDVYNKGQYIRTVFKNSGRGYAFTIQEEKIYIATYDTIDIVIVMDLSGNLIKTIDDIDEKERRRLEMQKNVFTYDDSVYFATNTMGFYKITKTNDGKSEVIYQKPMLDYICGVVQNVVMPICILVSLITTIPRLLRENDESKRKQWGRFILSSNLSRTKP